jgi:hypothetical protein
MKIVYKNTELEIFINFVNFDFNINEELDIVSLRAEFNKSIENLSKNNNSLLYWLMEISERNTLSSNLFLDICRIKMIDQLWRKNKDIVIYTNNLSIFLFFINKKNVSFKGHISFLIVNLFSFIRSYSSPLIFGYKKLKDYFLFSNKAFQKNISDSTIVQTWVNDGNFLSSQFKDSYFPGLDSSISSQKILIWPVFYNIASKKNAIKYIRKHHRKFILSEDYVSLIDYIHTIKFFFQKKSLNLGSIIIDGTDMTSVFNFYKKKEIIADGYLFYAFPKNLAKRKNRNVNFIVPFENMLREKALIIGVRKHLLNSKIIGYFHTTKPDNILCLEYAGIEESKIAPAPDKILFNSSIYKEIYKTKYSHLNTINSLAYKQLYLKNKMKKTRNNNKILIIFSGLDSDIKLMLSLLNSNSANCHYLFRMHPMNSFEINKYFFGNNFELVNDLTLDDSLSIASKVIATYSSVALESSLRGFYVGLVYDKKRLLINPFDNTGITDYQLISNEYDFNKYLESNINTQQNEYFFNLDDKFNDAIFKALN